MQDVIIRYRVEDTGVDALISKMRNLSENEREQIELMRKLDSESSKNFTNQNSGYGNLNKSISNIRNGIVAAFAFNQIQAFTEKIVQTTGAFQKYEAVLANSLGTNSRASLVMQSILEFASKTPFSVNELTQSYIKLVNAGFKPTENELQKLGDLASSTGKSFDQLTEAILDAQVGEFERLKEFGVRANKEGDNVRFTFKGVETQVKGTENEIRKYILSLGELQGVSGSMASISKTLEGQTSNLADSYEQLQNAIGKKFAPIISSSINGVSLLVQGLTYLVQGNQNVKTSTEKSIDAIRAEKEELNNLVKSIRDKNIGNETRLELVNQLNQKFPEFAKTIDVVNASEKDLEKALKAVNNQFELQIFNVAKKGLLEEYQKNTKDITNEQLLLLESLRKAESGQEGFEKAQIESAIQRNEGRKKIFKDGLEADLEALRKQLQSLGLTEKQANELANKTSQEKISIDKKASEELAKQRAEFDLRELEAQQKNAQEKIKNQIELNKLSLEGENVTNSQKIEIIRQNQNLEIELLALQNAQRKTQYEIDKNNAIQIKKLTQTEILNIDAETSQQQIVTNERVRKELEKLQMKTIEKTKSMEYNLADKLNEKWDSFYDNFKKKEDERLKDLEIKKEKESKIREKTAELAFKITDVFFQYNQNSLEKQTQNLQTQKNYELSLARGNKEQEIEINNRFAQKEREIKEKQAQSEKNKALFDVFLATSKNIVQAFPNYVLMALAGAIGVAQTVAITSRPIPKFRKGIDYLIPDGTGQDVDGMIIEAHRGERILQSNLNHSIRHIPNEQIPELVNLGILKKNETAYYPSKQDFYNAIREGLSQIPVNNVVINDKGFQTWIYTKSDVYNFVNKNNSW